MNKKYDLAQKQAVIARYKSGGSVAHIAQDTGIPRCTIYN